MCAHHVRVELTLKHLFSGHRPGLLCCRLRHRPDQSVVRQQHRNEQTGLHHVLQTPVGTRRPRVRRRLLRQGRVRCEGLAPLAARQGQQGHVVLQVVLRQRGGHSPISPTEPRCSIQNRFAKRLDVPLFIFSQSVQLALEAGRTCGSCQATEVSGWSTCDDDGRWTCNTCYLKEFRASKKEKKD
jgi:hypothetical protein